MKKFKFNAKAATSLACFVLGLIIIVVGSNNKYCLSFGLMFFGLALIMYMLYAKQKIEIERKEISEKFDEIHNLMEENNQTSAETTYVLGELSKRQSRLNKRAKSISFAFSACGVLLIILGFVNLF